MVTDTVTKYLLTSYIVHIHLVQIQKYTIIESSFVISGVPAVIVGATGGIARQGYHNVDM